MEGSGQGLVTGAGVLAAADAAGVAYSVLPCDPDLADTAAFCEHYGYSLDDSANTIVVASRRGPQRYGVCVVLASRRLDVNRTVRTTLGFPKASFASADETREVTGMEIGGVTPFGLPADLPLLIDPAVMTRERIVLGGGSRDQKLLVAPEALLLLPRATVVDGLAIPPG